MISERPERFYKPEKSRGAKRICSCGKTYISPMRNGIPLYAKCPSCRKEKEKKDPLKEKSIKELRKLAQKHFNAFIRERDKLTDDTFFCPTCGKIKRIEGNNYHACHFLPAGHYPALAMDEDNCFGGCLACNYYRHGVTHEYGEWVRKKIGDTRWNELMFKKEYYKRNSWKWDKTSLILKIETYKQMLKDEKQNRIGKGTRLGG